MSDGRKEHPLFGNAVEKANLEDLEDLEERSMTLLEGRRMSEAVASVSYQDDAAGRAARKSLAGVILGVAPSAERSMRDYTIERKTEPDANLGMDCQRESRLLYIPKSILAGNLLCKAVHFN